MIAIIVLSFYKRDTLKSFIKNTARNMAFSFLNHLTTKLEGWKIKQPLRSHLTIIILIIGKVLLFIIGI